MPNLPAFLFLVPLMTALVLAMVGFFRPKWCWGLAFSASLTILVLSIVGTSHVFSVGEISLKLGQWPVPLGIELLLDRLAAPFSVAIAVVAVIVIGASRGSGIARSASFFACSLLLVAGLMGIVVTSDLFNLFVQIEITSLSAYGLVAAGGKGAPRAAFRYLIIGSLGASFYLLGAGFLYAAAGTFNMGDMARIMSEGHADPRLVMVGCVLITTGLAVKMALFPLHGWMPEAYSRGIHMGVALMAPLVTKISAYALFRVLFMTLGTPLATNGEVVKGLLLAAGSVAAVYGGAMAFVQRDLWRLLAFSSVSQMGLVAIGFGLANRLGTAGALMHIVNDAVVKGALFLAAVVALRQFGVRRVDDLPALRGRSPAITATFIVGGLSLIGIPPLCGFFGKWYVLVGAIQAEYWPVAAAVVLSGMASIGYVFRILERLCFAPQADTHALAADRSAPLLASWGCVALAVTIVALGVFNETLLRWWLFPALPGFIGG